MLSSLLLSKHSLLVDLAPTRCSSLRPMACLAASISKRPSYEGRRPPQFEACCDDRVRESDAARSMRGARLVRGLPRTTRFRVAHQGSDSCTRCWHGALRTRCTPGVFLIRQKWLSPTLSVPACLDGSAPFPNPINSIHKRALMVPTQEENNR
jgi:hypothetical protein